MLKNLLSTKKGTRIIYLICLLFIVILFWIDETWRAQNWKFLSAFIPGFKDNVSLSWYDVCFSIGIAGTIGSLIRYGRRKGKLSRNIWRFFAFVLIFSSYVWTKFYTPSLIGAIVANHDNIIVRLLFPLVIPESWNDFVSFISVLKFIFVGIEIELAMHIHSFD